MSTANFEITVDYKSPNSTEILNRFNYPAITPGVYLGGTLSSPATDTLRIAEFTAYIKSTTNDVLVKVTSDGDHDVNISSSQPYVIMSYTWLNQQNNTVTFSAKAEEEILDTDVVFGMAEYSGATIIDFIYDDTTYGLIKSINLQENQDHLHIPTSKAILDFIFPIGDIYVQYPVAESDDEATAFPVAFRPATKFGGSWSELYNDEAIVFRTFGESGSRTDGYQADAMQGHWHDLSASEICSGGQMKYNNGGTGTTTGVVWQAGTNDGFMYISDALTDGSHGEPRIDSETRMKNRRMKIWKRTA